MLIRKRHVFASASPETTLRLAAAWSGTVGGLLLVMILVHQLSRSAL